MHSCATQEEKYKWWVPNLLISAKLTISYPWSFVSKLFSSSRVPSCLTRPECSLRSAVRSATRGTACVMFGLSFRCSLSKSCCFAISVISLSSASFVIPGKPQDAQLGDPLTQISLMNKGPKSRNAENEKNILDSRVNECIVVFAVRKINERKSPNPFSEVALWRFASFLNVSRRLCMQLDQVRTGVKRRDWCFTSGW